MLQRSWECCFLLKTLYLKTIKHKTMKTIRQLLQSATIAFLILFQCLDAYGQCSGGTSAGNITMSGCWQTVSINNGQYRSFTAVSGTTYRFSFCNGGGSSPSNFDTKITILTNSGSFANGYDDDGCGDLIRSELSWTAPSNGTFRVLVSRFTFTNSCNHDGNRTGTMAYKACTAPSITSNPSNLILCNGQSGSFTVNTSCNGSNTFQWQVKVPAGSFTNLSNTGIYSGATTATLSLSSVSNAINGNEYRCVVTNDDCSSSSNSNAATFTLNAGATSVINEGSNLSFCAPIVSTLLTSSTNGSSPTYQWKRNGSNISGATNANYTATQNGTYTVVITGGGCSNESNSSVVTFNPLPTASITQGASVNVCAPTTSTTLNATTNGSSPSYQWKRDGSNISGATNASYSATVNGAYTVVITSNGCNNESSASNVTFSPQPSATLSQGANTQICPPVTTLLITASTNGSSPTYQWKRNGSTISGATNANYTANQNGTYTVVITSGGCSNESSAAGLTFNPQPTGSISLVNSLCINDSTLLSVNAATTAYQTNTTLLNDTIKSIPDNSAIGVSSFINISNAPLSFSSVTGFSVTVNVTHPYSSDVEIYLIRPGGSISNSSNGGRRNTITNGQSVCLVSDAGGSGDNFVNTIFSDAAATLASANSAPFTGTYRPENLFSTLTGNPNGIWQLKVLDDAGDDLGSLQNWSITIDLSNGLSYTWSSTPSGLNSNAASVGYINPTVNTNYTVVITDLINGCTNTYNKNLVVNQLPQFTPSTNGPICELSNNLTLETNFAGSALSYAWTGPNGFNSSQASPVIVNAASNTSGIYSVLVTDQNGCKKSQSTNAVVHPLPNPEVISLGNGNTYCTGGAPFDLTTSQPYSGYLWNNNATTNFISINTGGTFSVVVTDANGCSNNNQIVIDEHPSPTPPIVVPDAGITICTHDANTFTNISFTATNYGATGLFWSNGQSDITTASFDQPMQVYCTITDNNGCTGISNIIDIEARYYSTAATSAVVADSNLCIGNSTILQAIGGSLEMNDQWHWYAGTCNSNPVGIGQTINVTPSSSTTYYVRAEGTCGVTTCVEDAVTVFTAAPTATVQSLNAPTNMCTGNTQSIAVPLVANATYYNWTAPLGSLINGQPSPMISTGNTVQLTAGNTISSGYNVCVFAGNACGITTNTRCAFIRGVVSIPGAISGTPVVCSNTTSVYEVSPVAGAEVYVWTLPAHASIISGAGTNQITVSFDHHFNGGVIEVAAGLNCGYLSGNRSMQLSNSPAMPLSITSPARGCPGASVSLAIANVNNASGYNWTLPSGANITYGSGTNSIEVLLPANFNGGTFCVSSLSACGGSSANRCKSMATDLPLTPAAVLGPNQGVCGSLLNYSTSSIAGATNYQWNVPNGATIISGNGTSSISVQYPNNITTGQIAVRAGNGCGLGSPRNYLVRGIPGIPGNINGQNAVCNGDILSYNIPSVTGASSYLWQVPAGSNILSGQGSNEIIVEFGAISGNIVCTPQNSCGNSNARSLSVGIGCRSGKPQSPATPLLQAFPNPVLQTLSLRFGSTENDAQLKIYDLNGSLLYDRKIEAGIDMLEIDMQQFASGMYQIVWINDGYLQQTRIHKM
jgi:large repetitive protein